MIFFFGIDYSKLFQPTGGKENVHFAVYGGKWKQIAPKTKYKILLSG